MTKKEFKEYEQLAKDYYIARKTYKEKTLKMDKAINGKAEKIKEFLLSCDSKKYTDKESGFSLKFVEPQIPIFDIERLEKSIPIYASKAVIKKKFIVKDETLLVALLKRCGVPMDDFQECLTLEKEVDEKALEQCIAMGEVTQDMLAGTYTIKKKKAYIKVTEKD